MTYQQALDKAKRLNNHAGISLVAKKYALKSIDDQLKVLLSLRAKTERLHKKRVSIAVQKAHVAYLEFKTISKKTKRQINA